MYKYYVSLYNEYLPLMQMKDDMMPNLEYIDKTVNMVR